ncbi:hypothetical protein HDV05_008328 [Chytridiales sp. JEL 0842]|nr:hypothetical protein HDV05_008328 [Chytridiales sp. JEL 0842]
MPPPLVGSHCKAIAPHTPSQSDELLLEVDDLVIIKDAYDDGWCLATKIKTGEEGLIPGNFVELYKGTQPASAPQDVKPPAVSPVASAVGGSAVDPPKALRRMTSLAHRSPQTQTSTSIPTASSNNISYNPSSLPAGASDLRKRWESLQQARERRAKTPANMGELKLLVAGDTGIGKSTLIQRLLTTPSIHNPPTLPTPSALPSLQEIRASTVPPMSLHASEDPQNLTLIDTPGFGSFLDAGMVMKSLSGYCVSMFQGVDGVFAKGVSAKELVKYLRGGGVGMVDGCLYGILHRVKPVDVEFMRQLAGYTNVIPVILKGDTLTPPEIRSLKISVLEELQRANVDFHTFGFKVSELIELVKEGVGCTVPFVVSRDSNGGVDELEALRRGVFYVGIEDLRVGVAERTICTASASSPFLNKCGPTVRTTKAAAKSYLHFKAMTEESKATTMSPVDGTHSTLTKKPYTSSTQPSSLRRSCSSYSTAFIILIPMLLLAICTAIGKVELFGIIVFPLIYLQTGLLQIHSLISRRDDGYNESYDSNTDIDDRIDDKNSTATKKKLQQADSNTTAILTHVGLTLFYVSLAAVPVAAYQITKNAIFLTVGMPLVIVVNASCGLLVFFMSRRNRKP